MYKFHVDFITKTNTKESLYKKFLLKFSEKSKKILAELFAYLDMVNYF